MELRKIKMNVSLVGASFAYDPDREYDVPVDLAVALVASPEDEPRAEPVGWELVDGVPVDLEPEAPEVPAAPETEPQPPAEVPAAPEVETRETATAPRPEKRGAKKS